jgi:myo-inositol-1(or 4)-monophosphatase
VSTDARLPAKSRKRGGEGGSHANQQGGSHVADEQLDVEELSRFAVEALQRTGEVALTFYGRGKESVKFDEELVTEAEIQLSERFEAQLRKHFPEHQLFRGDLGEATPYTHGQQRYLWIFDPLDGVANFMAGIPIWGISVALFDNFWPIFGAFYMPVTEDLFHAVAGGKAFWGQRQIRVSAQESITDESVLLTFSRFHQHYRTRFPGKVRNLGSTAAHICYVAMGRAEAAHTAHESFQDLAAVRVIIEAAGGAIFNMDGSPFIINDYLEGGRNDTHLLVVAPDKCRQVLDSLTPLY